MQKFAQLRELKVSGGIEDVNEALTAAQVPGDAVISVLFTPAPTPNRHNHPDLSRNLPRGMNT